MGGSGRKSAASIFTTTITHARSPAPAPRQKCQECRLKRRCCPPCFSATAWWLWPPPPEPEPARDPPRNTATSAPRARRPKLCHALPAPASLLAAAVKAGPCSARRFTTISRTTCAPKTCTKGTLARPRTCGHKSSAPDVSQRLAFQMKACKLLRRLRVHPQRADATRYRARGHVREVHRPPRCRWARHRPRPSNSELLKKRDTVACGD